MTFFHYCVGCPQGTFWTLLTASWNEEGLKDSVQKDIVSHKLKKYVQANILKVEVEYVHTYTHTLRNA